MAEEHLKQYKILDSKNLVAGNELKGRKNLDKGFIFIQTFMMTGWSKLYMEFDFLCRNFLNSGS